VKSSAITPRQPEVPKCIAWFVTDGYCILALQPQSHNIQNDARRTSKDTENFQMTKKIVVLVTCGSTKEARKIARALVEHRIAACVNILASPVQSVYRWKGSVESAKEFLLIIKTTKARFPQLKAEVGRLHRYEVPEIIVLPIATGSAAYLKWISESVASVAKDHRSGSE
jgi:periplasmic divalent cation tolerance protein